MWIRPVAVLAIVSAMFVGVAEADFPSGYPVSGTVSQGRASVDLGYLLGVCAPGTVCPAIGGYAGVHRISVRTPGALQVHLSVAATVLKAGDQSYRAVVKRLGPREAVVTFHHRLQPARHYGTLRGLKEYAWVQVEVAASRYVFYFDPTPQGKT